MNKIQEFTQAEREKYSHLYLDLVSASDEIAPFLSQEEQSQRHFNRRMHIIKEYLDALDTADQKADGQGLFEFFKSDEKYKEEALAVKYSLKTDLDKLQLCHTCKCLTCAHPCPFKSCKACKSSYYTLKCDKERYSIVSGHSPLTLYSNDEHRDVHFRVLGVLRDQYANKNYIYLVETKNPDNQHILEFIQYVNGTYDYTPLDADILDKIYDIFVRFDCYE